MAPRIILITFLLVDYHVKNRIPFIDQNYGRKLPHEKKLRQFFTTRNNCAASTRRMVRFVWYPCAPMNSARALDRRSVSTTAVRAAPCPSPNSKSAPRKQNARGAWGSNGTRRVRAGHSERSEILETFGTPGSQSTPGVQGASEAKVHPGHLGNPGHPRPKCTRGTWATRDTRGRSVPGTYGTPGQPRPPGAHGPPERVRRRQTLHTTPL